MDSVELLAGRYAFTRALGEGASGRVYEAEDLRDGKLVAVKCLRVERRPTPQQVARFKDEFRVVHDLAHPNIARIYDLVEDGGEFAIVLELVNGVDVVSYVRDDGAHG